MTSEDLAPTRGLGVVHWRQQRTQKSATGAPPTYAVSLARGPSGRPAASSSLARGPFATPGGTQLLGRSPEPIHTANVPRPKRLPVWRLWGNRLVEVVWCDGKLTRKDSSPAPFRRRTWLIGGNLRLRHLNAKRALRISLVGSGRVCEWSPVCGVELRYASCVESVRQWCVRGISRVVSAPSDVRESSNSKGVTV